MQPLFDEFVDLHRGNLGMAGCAKMVTDVVPRASEILVYGMA
ncbi:MAG: hypothetical protein M5U23_10720 [Acidimicrobiia bacterium]|nr:hypothetical protein [Acidimicrobiia bacterium]